MSKIVAVNLFNDHAVLVTATASAVSTSFKITNVHSVPLPHQQINLASQISANGGSVNYYSEHHNENSNQNINDFKITQLAEIGESDAVVALLLSPHVIYSRLLLPFNDSKKVEQVAPFQLQDILPFETDSFVIHNSISDQKQNGEYRILTSLVPEADVQGALNQLALIGADPKLVTTPASSLASLALHCFPDDSSLRAYLSFNIGFFSLAVLHASKPILLRDFYYSQEHGGLFWVEIRRTLAMVEHEFGSKISVINVLGSKEYLAATSQALPYPIQQFDTTTLVEMNEAVGNGLEEISWSFGIFANELLKTKKSTRSLVDFRQGALAYRRNWQEFRTAIQDEVLFIIAALIFVVFWFGIQIYNSYSDLNQLDLRLENIIKKSIPSEDIYIHAASDQLKGKIGELEEELRSMGSLSALSPLETLNELVSAIGNIDVMLETVNIGYSHLSMKGTVAELGLTGTLSEALKQKVNKFTDVQVETQPNANAGSRIGFRAEMNLVDLGSSIGNE